MPGHKKYDLNDDKEVTQLNRLLNPAGIGVEQSLFGLYILVDTDRYDLFLHRRAGRRPIITKRLQWKIYTLRFEHRSIREIAKETGVSTTTVRKVLEGYSEDEETEQLTLGI